MKEQLAHLVFLQGGGILLVKRPEASWRQLQDEYQCYVASLGPWSAPEICEYFALDYGNNDSAWPFRQTAIIQFMQAAEPYELELPS